MAHRDTRKDPAHDDVVDDDGPVPPSRPFLVGLVLILITLTFLLARPYLGPLVLAFLVAFMVYPIHKRLAPHMRWPSLSAFLLVILVILVIVAPFAFVIWQMLDTLQRVVVLLQDPQQVEERVRDLLASFGVRGQDAAELMSTAGQRAAEALAGMILPTLQFIIKALLALVVFLFVLFFAIRDGKKWTEALKEYTPLTSEDKEELFQGAHDSVWAIVMGTFVVSVVQGVVAGIGWWLFGFPDPIFWGFVMVVLAVLPFVGAFAVAIPAGIIAVINGDYFSGFGLIIYTSTVVAVSDDLLRPYLIGKRSGIHPVFILVGILGGIALFGIAGFVIGPLILALLPPVIEVWGSRRKQLAHDRGLHAGEAIE